MAFEVKIKHTIEDAVIAGVLCSAVEGGSNSWAGFKFGYPGDEVNPDATLEENDGKYVWMPIFRKNGTMIVREAVDEDGFTFKKHTIDRSHIEKALKLMETQFPEALTAILEEQDDADTGDILLQLAVFGEIVYS